MMNEFFFVDRALKGPTGTDAHGRVIYGTFDTTGTAYPDLVDQRFVHAVDMVPQQGAHSWEMSIGVTQLLSTGFTASAAYTHSRVRDAMTMTDPFGFGNLDTHPVAGRVEDQTIGVSDFDLPHRVLVAGTFTAPWKRWRTDVSILYTGGSGAPFTLTTGGGRADLNADGNDFNDPIYIPRDVDNGAEIAFNGTAEEIADQRAAFRSLIANTGCLARQRGRIMARNSCRGPWVNSLNLSLRQTVPAPHSHGLAVELEIFNMLNLLHAGWGSVAQVNTAPLTRVAEIQTSPAGSTSVFQFDKSYRLFSSDQTDSYYQIQLAARYSF